jgi:hypothetical protein
MIDHGTKEYQQMVNLRNEILRKPLGLYFTEEELEGEKDDILMGAFEDDRLLGCCILTPMGAGTVRLRQMAVPGNMQGKGVDDLCRKRSARSRLQETMYACP